MNPEVMIRDVRSEFTHNHDVLSVIFDFLSIDPMSTMTDDMIIEMRRTLVHTALACKDFTEPALDSLWKVLPSFMPLFRLFPAFVIEHQIGIRTYVPEYLGETDWEKFEYYARRVRVLCLTRAYARVSNFIYARVNQKHVGPLLKGLRKLYVATGEFDHLSDAFLALNPCLEIVELHEDAIRNAEFIQPFLFVLKQDAPRLRHLVMRGQSTINLSSILLFDNLRHLEIRLPNSYLSTRFMDLLGDVESLRELILHVGSAVPVGVPPLVGRSVPSKRPGFQRRYRQIRSLHLIGEVHLLGRIMMHMDLQNLKRFVLDQERQSNHQSDFWIQCFQQLSSSEEIEEIEIRQYPTSRLQEGSSLSVSAMSPLFRLQHLKALVVRESSFCVSDNDLLEVMPSLASLEKLIFPHMAEPQSGPPTIESLLRFSQQCPKLQEIEMCIGGTLQDTVSINQTLTRRGNHPLRVLRISSTFRLQSRDAIEYALFLYRAFPNLENIVGVGPNTHAESWSVVHAFYNALQTEVKNNMVQ